MKVNVKDNSDEFIKAKDEAIRRGLESIGITAEGYAKIALSTASPKPAVDTGLLRNSVTYAVSGESPAISSYRADTPKEGRASSGSYEGQEGNPSEQKVYVGTNVEYAPYIEFGTSKMPARPYLKPCITDHNDEYKKLIEDELKKG